MRTKNRPLIEEAPLIALGLLVATAAQVAATVLLRSARVGMRITGLDRPATRTRSAH